MMIYPAAIKAVDNTTSPARRTKRTARIKTTASTPFPKTTPSTITDNITTHKLLLHLIHQQQR